MDTDCDIDNWTEVFNLEKLKEIIAIKKKEEAAQDELNYKEFISSLPKLMENVKNETLTLKIPYNINILRRYEFLMKVLNAFSGCKEIRYNLDVERIYIDKYHNKELKEDYVETLKNLKPHGVITESLKKSILEGEENAAPYLLYITYLEFHVY